GHVAVLAFLAPHRRALGAAFEAGTAVAVRAALHRRLLARHTDAGRRGRRDGDVLALADVHHGHAVAGGVARVRVGHAVGATHRRVVGGADAVGRGELVGDAVAVVVVVGRGA